MTSRLKLPVTALFGVLHVSSSLLNILHHLPPNGDVAPFLGTVQVASLLHMLHG